VIRGEAGREGAGPLSGCASVQRFVDAGKLLENLKNKDVHLEVSGERLIVDGPAGVIAGALRATLAEHKLELIKLLKWERRKLEEADRHRLGHPLVGVPDVERSRPHHGGVVRGEGQRVLT
jgi:hypothetical protein